MKRKDVLPLCDIALTAESRVEPPVPSCHRTFPSMRNCLPGSPSTQLSTSGTPPKVRGQMPPASMQAKTLVWIGFATPRRKSGQRCAVGARHLFV